MVRSLWLSVLLLWSATATAATFTAAVDRTALYVNEHVLLTLALDNSETRLRAEGVAPNIDLTVLSDDFELGIPRADFRFNIDRNRGRSTSSITVELFPRRSGRLTVPSFTVDGLSTAPVTLDVHELPADVREEVFVRSGVVNDRLYLRQQTLVWLDLYHRVSLASARLGGAIETRPRRVELHLLPPETRSEVLDGIEYQVSRTAWAISPLSDEPITVYLPDVWVETRAGRQWRLPFDEQTIAVSALPTGVDVDTLIGRPTLRLGEPTAARVGDVVPWELTLTTTTAMNALPAELPFAPHDAGFKVYMDPPERRVALGDDGEVESIAVYRGALMPLAAGNHALPTIELPWFNPGHGGIEIARVAGPTLQVSGARADDAPAGDGPSAPDGGVDAVRHWQLTSLVLALLWLSTAAMWWWRQRPPPGRRITAAAPAGHDVRRRLLDALDSRTLEEGLQRQEQRFGIDEELRATVRAVQRHCYHPGREAAAADGLEARVDQAIRTLRERAQTSYPPAAAPDLSDPWAPESFAPGRRRD